MKKLAIDDFSTLLVDPNFSITSRFLTALGQRRLGKWGARIARIWGIATDADTYGDLLEENTVSEDYPSYWLLITPRKSNGWRLFYSPTGHCYRFDTEEQAISWLHNFFTNGDYIPEEVEPEVINS